MSKNSPKSFDTIVPTKTERIPAAVELSEELEAVGESIYSLDVSKKQRRMSILKQGFSIKAKPILISISLLFGVSVVLSTVMLGYEGRYLDKAYPGVVVWGEPVGGKNVSEIQQLLGEKTRNYQITIKGPDQEYIAKSIDLGLIVNIDEMSSSAITLGRDPEYFAGLTKKVDILISLMGDKYFEKYIKNSHKIQPKVSFDQQKFDLYVSSISENIKIAPQDSEVTVSGSTMQLKPAIYGREVNKEKLISDIKGNILTFTTGDINVEVSRIKPAIVDNAAEEVMLQAENVMKRPVILTYQGQEYRPSQETVASWIGFRKVVGSSKYDLYIDETKMSGYFAFLSSKISVEPTPKKVRIENNVKESVTQEGVDGLVIDKKTLAAKIASQLPIRTSVKEEIPTYVDKFKTVFERVVVENDEKYIVVDISDQRMTAYLKGGQVVDSWGVVTGNPNLGRATPIGKWLIGGKSASVNMTDGSRCDRNGYRIGGTYCLPGVEWVSWLITPGHGSGYAIHDADHWRDPWMYGNTEWYKVDGSHGCVNSPNQVAKFIYDWAPIGTPVYIQE